MVEVVRTHAGTSAHGSGAQRFFSRALYIFFGKPFSFLVPALLIIGAGGFFATSKPDEFKSVGVLSVSTSTFLGDLSQVRSTAINYEAPSVKVARQFNELMQTDGFAESVIEGAGLSDTVASGVLSVPDVREHVFATATGDSLLRITAISKVPELARLLAVSGIAAFKNYVISSEVLGSNVAESFYDEQLASYKTEVDTANAALAAYLLSHPGPTDSRIDRDIAEQLEIQRLDEELARATERFDGASDNRELSRLATMQSSADIGQRFRTLDEPTASDAPTSGLKSLAITLILFGVLGLLASSGIVALACLLDRSIHSAADLERLGSTVRAVVPQSKTLKVETPRHLAIAPNRDAPVRTAG